MLLEEYLSVLDFTVIWDRWIYPIHFLVELQDVSYFFLPVNKKCDLNLVSINIFL